MLDVRSWIGRVCVVSLLAIGPLGCSVPSLFSPNHVQVTVIATTPVEDGIVVSDGAWESTVARMGETAIAALTGCKLCFLAMAIRDLGLGAGGVMTEVARQAATASLRAHMTTVPIRPGQAATVTVEIRGDGSSTTRIEPLPVRE